MSPTVSIIVPVYNAKNTIRRCIESILRQTYPDFELLLVDDGSKDGSGAICDEYAAADRRVRVFHKENGGVSAARNLALDNAQGAFLQFLDSDDWITPDATQLMVRAMEEENCDLVITDFYRVVGERVSPKGDIEEEGVLSREEFAAHMMENPADFYYGVLWNKLFRRSIVEALHLRMDTAISWCEDFLFNLEYIRRAQRFYALQVPVYYYVKTKGSLASQGMNISKTVQMKLTVFEYYNRLYKDILDEEEYQRQRLKVYRFLLDAAGDGSAIAGAQRLGSERVQVQPEMLAEVGIMADALREWKLLERCVEPTALAGDLTLKEAILLLALGHDGFSGKREDLAQLSHLSRSGLTITLQQLVGKRFVQVQRKKVTVLPEGQAVLSNLERGISDWKSLRFSGFSQEETAQYNALSARVRENVRQALS